MDSISAKELSKQTFEGITIAKPFSDLFGPIELKAVGLIWGENYSGKSTFALGLANAMANFGRVEYVPAEEHFGITLTKKINQLKAYNENLNFRRYKGLEGLKKWLKSVGAKVVLIDSISVLSENDNEVIAFAQWCRTEKIGMWMVNHANKDKTYKGNSKLAHEVDIQVEVMKDDKMAYTRKNRYLGELRSIPVPFTAKDIEQKKAAAPSKKASKKSSAKKKTKTKSKPTPEFDSTMNEVEELLNS